MGEVEHSLDCGIRGGGESEDEGGDGLLGHLRKTWPRWPETGGGGGLGGPSNLGVISMKSGAGLTRVMLFISKKLGLKLQETTQQVVKEMGMLLHTLLSKFGGLAVLAHQVLLPKGVPLPSTREVVTIIVGGGRKTTIKEDRVVHLRRRHMRRKVGRGGK